MKILQVCLRFPYPPQDGGTMAMHNLTEGLLMNGNEVKVLALNTKKHFVDTKRLPADYIKKTSPEFIDIDTSVNVSGILKSFFSKDSYNISRFFSQAFENKLTRLLSEHQYDIVQLESLYVTPYIKAIRANSKAKIVLRAHNIEHMIWQKLTDNCKNPVKRAYLKLLTERLKEYEFEAIKKVDAIASITAEDAMLFRQMGFKKQIINVPFGIDTNKFIDLPGLTEAISVYHLGSMDWEPNVEGVEWFLKNVWNIISSKYPEMKCYIAGRNMPQGFINMKMHNLFVEGEITDAKNYIRDKAILVVPLFSGSGMRVKIIEAMAAGKLVISTRLGAQGIEYENGKNMLIADNAAEFIGQIEQSFRDKQYYISIAKNGKALAGEKYSNKNICETLHHFYTNLITG